MRLLRSGSEVTEGELSTCHARRSRSAGTGTGSLPRAPAIAGDPRLVGLTGDFWRLRSRRRGDGHALDVAVGEAEVGHAPPGDEVARVARAHVGADVLARQPLDGLREIGLGRADADARRRPVAEPGGLDRADELAPLEEDRDLAREAIGHPAPEVVAALLGLRRLAERLAHVRAACCPAARRRCRGRSGSRLPRRARTRGRGGSSKRGRSAHRWSLRERIGETNGEAGRCHRCATAGRAGAVPRDPRVDRRGLHRGRRGRPAEGLHPRRARPRRRQRAATPCSRARCSVKLHGKTYVLAPR